MVTQPYSSHSRKVASHAWHLPVCEFQACLAAASVCYMACLEGSSINHSSVANFHRNEHLRANRSSLSSSTCASLLLITINENSFSNSQDLPLASRRWR